VYLPFEVVLDCVSELRDYTPGTADLPLRVPELGVSDSGEAGEVVGLHTPSISETESYR
jgi:hypothetical protein